MNLTRSLFLWKFKPRIAHSLPGRVRLHAPILRWDGNAPQGFFEAIQRLFAIPKGIQSAEVSLHTGNLLIRYDIDTITEGEIVEFVRRIHEIAFDVWPRASQLLPEQVPGFMDRLEAALRGAVKNRIEIDKEFVVPEDVWPETETSA